MPAPGFKNANSGPKSSLRCALAGAGAIALTITMRRVASIQTILQTRVLHGNLVFVETSPQGIAAFAGKYRDDPSLTQIREDIYLARDAEPKE
jgi:hypothetical protein